MFVFYYCLVFASVEQLPSNPYHGERNEGNLCTKVFNKSYIPYTTESREWSVYILRFVFSDKICFPSENSDLLRLIFSELPIEQKSWYMRYYVTSCYTRARSIARKNDLFDKPSNAKIHFYLRKHCFPSSICNIHFR